MNKLKVLLGIGLKNELDIFKFNKSNKKRGPIKTILMTILVMYILAALLFSVVFYAYMIAEPLSKLNLTYVAVALFYMVTVIMTFIGGINKSQGALFTAKDNDMLFAMPIKKRDILTARFMQLMFFEYIWTFMIMVPAIGVYSYFEHPAMSFYFVSLLMLLLLPIIPLLLSTVFGYLIQLLSSKSKRRTLARTLLGIVFLLVFMYFSYGIQKYIPKIVAHATSISDFLEKIYYPLGVYISCILKTDWLKLICVLAINLVVFVIVMNVLSLRYFKLLSKLSEKHSESNYKMKELKSESMMRALISKELKRFFSSSIYIMNTLFGIVLFFVGAIYVAYKGEQGLNNIFKQASTTDMTFLLRYMSKAVMIMSAFCISTCAITASSISIEGKTFWLVKSLPIPTKKVFLSKILVSILLILPLMVIGNIIFAVYLKFSMIDIILSLILCIVFTIFESLLGLLLNLKFPKLDAANDVMVVKQSLSAMLGLFIPMFLMILPVILFSVLDIQRINIYVSIWLGIYLVLDCIIWYILKVYGTKRLYNI